MIDTTPLPPRSDANFRTTHWSLVAAAQGSDSSGRRRALGRLYEQYHFPLYAYVRRRGYNADDARDLTHEFFRYLLEKETVDSADQRRGRFRTFLLTAAANFLHNEWDKCRALKRGGAVTMISWDAQTAEERYLHEPMHELSPDKLFDYRWAVAVLDAAKRALHEEYQRPGKAALFDAIQSAVFSEGTTDSYAEIAQRFGITEGALKVAVHRMRQRFARLIRDEIAQTIESGAELEDEFHALLAAVQVPGCNFFRPTL
jgi:RNA polymerase sigma factor (sigma-70 family)